MMVFEEEIWASPEDRARYLEDLLLHGTALGLVDANGVIRHIPQEEIRAYFGARCPDPGTDKADNDLQGPRSGQ